MPRQVDHVGRRRLIAEAVCHLADERGLEGVTLRDVAARAQVSMGAVQRCFRTKEEMLVFALGHIGEQITERVQARLVRSPAQSAGTALGHAVTEISLLREEHRAEARVWLAFVAQAAVSEVLARTLKANYATLQEAFTRLIAEAGEDADGAGRLDARREARTLLALADGLTTHVLIGHLTPQEAYDVLHAHLADLWERSASSPSA
ncbi:MULTISPECIES: TetR/AcrR family transcriptional regulator [Streptomyces]|uniref:TetR/AcrR family transcriptional regulator n=1 Tax=Streptomyces TaxID=1883 RepID=UPI0004C638A3|nr:TetR/AcrR family transcriptional regulator [Streptomyces sp. NRRL S-237]